MYECVYIELSVSGYNVTKDFFYKKHSIYIGGNLNWLTLSPQRREYS